MQQDALHGTERNLSRHVDLDAVAAELERHRAGWLSKGVSSTRLTWRDATSTWPVRIETDRAKVVDPESLGLKFQGPGQHEAELVLWRGGWSDFGAFVDHEVLVNARIFFDVATCISVADWVVDLLVGDASPVRPWWTR